MSFVSKNKENNKHDWSSDALLELSDIGNKQLRTLESMNFSHIHIKCQQELESWHSAAVAHLGQIYSQRLADLAQKMIDQLKIRIMPRISKALDDPTPDPEKVDKMQNLLCHIKSEYNDYGILVDIWWMPSLSVFVILTIHSVYLYDSIKPSPNLPIKVDAIQPADRSYVLASISPFERDIYVNYHKGVHIDQYHVSSTSQWTLEKRYSKSGCCETKDIGIRDVRCDSQYICLLIM
ncbi:unnamed protein product [Rotaria sordida]|uniref:Uncharacterized protein n=1 Tax=Rotaria sordida TaxID=392033 RepID=A0A814DYU9_9BILA|nr:unnamed protein product [Rotaria sordida]